MATRKRAQVVAPTTVRRTGRPLTVYLSDRLSHALASASQKRKVHKSDIVRVAIERLLNDLETGQLELPLGM
jgi:transcriptional regulator NrdR family protein